MDIPGQHGAMTVSGQPDSPATPEIIVRDYAESDYGACRSLWAELTEYHRMGSWVAESHGQVTGLTGLFDRGMSGEVEPVVVAAAARNRGIGRMLISRVAEEARARGYQYLAIRPVARNIAAIRRFHAAGFRTLGGHIDLTMDLAARRHEWLPGASLHDLDFDY